MKLIIEKELLLDRLKKAINFVPDKAVVPAMMNFGLVVCNNQLSIIGGNGESQIRLFCPCESKDTFSFFVPAGLLLKTVSLFRENEITFSIVGKKVNIKSGKSKYSIGMDCFESDYPLLTVDNLSHEISIHQSLLKSIFKTCNGFINTKNVRLEMTGINIATIDKKIVLTALDSTIMCRANITPIAIGTWGNIIVPAETTKKVTKLLEDKGEVCMNASADRVVFSSPDFEIISTLIAVKFPNSEGIFAKKPEKRILINTLEFLDAVKRLKPYAPESADAPVVVIKTNPDNLNELIITATDTLTNKEGEEIMTCENETGMLIDKCFSADHVITILSEIEQDNFYLMYSDDNKRPSFMEAKVNSEQEKVFNFLISNRTA